MVQTHGYIRNFTFKKFHVVFLIRKLFFCPILKLSVNFSRFQYQHFLDTFLAKMFYSCLTFFKGEYSSLIQEMKLVDGMLFFQQFRMTPGKYESLLRLVGHTIRKSSVRRDAISPGERLAVTLRYLVTGDGQSTIAASYRSSITSVHRIVKETSDAIWDELQSAGYLRAPGTEDEWKSIAFEFEERWNFPNCVGAIDGKDF